MKKYVPLAALLILACACLAYGQTAPAATPSPSPKPKPVMSKAQILKKLSASETKLWEGWKNKDPKPFKASLSADSVLVGENGVAGKNDGINDITNAPCEVKSYTLSDWKLTMLNPSTAVLTYKSATDGTCAGQPIPGSWSTSIWVNRGGKWLAAFHQETMITQK